MIETKDTFIKFLVFFIGGSDFKRSQRSTLQEMVFFVSTAIKFSKEQH